MYIQLLKLTDMGTQRENPPVQDVQYGTVITSATVQYQSMFMYQGNTL